jgi:hypothetical protein
MKIPRRLPLLESLAAGKEESLVEKVDSIMSSNGWKTTESLGSSRTYSNGKADDEVLLQFAHEGKRAVVQTATWDSEDERFRWQRNDLALPKEIREAIRAVIPASIRINEAKGKGVRRAEGRGPRG